MMLWLTSKLGGLWADVLVFVVMAVLIAAPFIYTYHAGKTNCEQKQIAAENAGMKQLFVYLQDNSAIAGDYYLRRAATETKYQTLTKVIPHVTTEYIYAVGEAPRPLPECVYTRGYVRVHNAAFVSGGGPQLADGPAPADSTDLLRANVTQADVLGNTLQNGAICADLRDRASALIAIGKNINAANAKLRH